MMFGISARISIASLIAFAIGEYQDVIAFFFFKNKSAALNYNNLQDRTNGYDNEQLLMNHLNPLNPHSELAYNGVFTKVDPDADPKGFETALAEVNRCFDEYQDARQAFVEIIRRSLAPSSE